MKDSAARNLFLLGFLVAAGCGPGRVAMPVLPDQPPMVRVPAGEYTIGDDDGPANERPAHKVRLRAFMIDRYEVTNRSYLRFVRETGFPAPPRWLPDSTMVGATDRLPFAEDEAELPVTYVSWHDAVAYARWRGCRLPTEAEWEVAARCSTAAMYPWGNDTLATGGKPVANTSDTGDGHAALAPVGSFAEGRSCWGVDDMLGNVWEWTADWYVPSAYRDAPTTGFSAASSDSLFAQRVIRGGSWFDSLARTKATTRNGFDPASRTDILGFRCARDAE